jgi:hypothetical protein
MRQCITEHEDIPGRYFEIRFETNVNGCTDLVVVAQGVGISVRTAGAHLRCWRCSTGVSRTDNVISTETVDICNDTTRPNIAGRRGALLGRASVLISAQRVGWCVHTAVAIRTTSLDWGFTRIHSASPGVNTLGIVGGVRDPDGR